MSIDNKIKERIEKLKNLAERGVGGEKETAHKKLDKLLKENGITEDDLNEDSEQYYLFSYTDVHTQKLLCQVITKVLGSNCKFYKTKKTRNKIGAYCTPAQKIEIDLDYEFYNRLFQEEVDILLTAFVDKQDIFPKDVTVRDGSELTLEELDRYKRAKAFGQTIRKQKRASGLIEEQSKSSEY